MAGHGSKPGRDRRSKLRRRESGSKLPHSQSGLRPRRQSEAAMKNR